MLNELVVDENGTQYWYKDEQLHREDGPAVLYADGTKVWWRRGVWAGVGDKPDPELWARKEGAPKIYAISLGGHKWWYRDGKLHRDDGPAVEYANGTEEWYFYGEYLGGGVKDFWRLWDRLTPEQRGNPSLLRRMPP